MRLDTSILYCVFKSRETRVVQNIVVYVVHRAIQSNGIHYVFIVIQIVVCTSTRKEIERTSYVI